MTDTKPMQGLAAYLRAEARSCVIGKDNRATLMEWASEVEAALAAPPEPLVDIKQMQEIIRDVHQHIQQGHLSEEFVAKQRPGYGTGVYTHIYHQMCKLSGLLKPIQAPQPVIGMQTLHDAITADPSLCDIDEPQPVKQDAP